VHAYLMLDGSVNGRSNGMFRTLQFDKPEAISSRGQWIPTTGMDEYCATLATWFGLPAADLNTLFPNLGNFPITNLGFFA